MKTKILYAFALMFLMTACSSDPKTKAKKSIEAYLKTNLNDPSSYEFVKVGEFKTFTLADWKQQQVTLKYAMTDSNPAANSPEFLAYRAQLAKLFQSEEYQKLKDDDQIEALKKIQFSMDSLKSVVEKKEIAALDATKDVDSKVAKSYTMDLTYRAKNKLGALGLETTTFGLDSAFNVLGARSVE